MWHFVRLLDSLNIPKSVEICDSLRVKQSIKNTINETLEERKRLW